MKTIHMIATALIVLVLSSVAMADQQSTWTWWPTNADKQVYVDRQIVSQAGICVTNIMNNACAGYINRECPAAIQCSQTVKAAKASCPNCATKKWVMDQLRTVFKKNAEDLQALRDEIQAKLDELEDRIAALEGRVSIIEKHEPEQDADIADLKIRVRVLEKHDPEQDAATQANTEAIADLEGSQLHLELSGFGDFALSGNVSVLGAMAGIALGIAENVDATVGVGLGGSFDKELAISIRAGLMLRPSKGARGFALGFLGFGTFEGLEDDGDRELGGLALLRYTFGKDPVDSGFFIEVFGGVAYESVVVAVPQPIDSPIRETTRKGAAAGNLGFGLGYRF